MKFQFPDTANPYKTLRGFDQWKILQEALKYIDEGVEKIEFNYQLQIKSGQHYSSIGLSLIHI